MENLIVFINYSNQIPVILGMLGKENLISWIEIKEKLDDRFFEGLKKKDIKIGKELLNLYD